MTSKLQIVGPGRITPSNKEWKNGIISGRQMFQQQWVVEESKKPYKSC